MSASAPFLFELVALEFRGGRDSTRSCNCPYSPRILEVTAIAAGILADYLDEVPGDIDPGKKKGRPRFAEPA
jgi:hypothetical protein